MKVKNYSIDSAEFILKQHQYKGETVVAPIGKKVYNPAAADSMRGRRNHGPLLLSR